MRIKKSIPACLVGIIFTVVCSTTFALNVASWNIQRLGHGSNKDYVALGTIIAINKVDIIAIQEVMNEKGIEALKKSVDHLTGERWEVMLSHRVGKNSYKEMYAFMWRSSKVKYLKNAVVYLDPRNIFAREPFSALFEDMNSNQVFLLATVHIVFGKKMAQRNAEVKELASYWEWLSTSFPDTKQKIILMGDFNMNPHKTSWIALKRVANPLLNNGASTVSAIDGKFANLYDNFWVSNQNVLKLSESRILIHSPLKLHLNHQQFRRAVSDHVPIILSLN